MTRAKPTQTLPDKLSDLLRLAVKDARAVAKMKTRVLDMFVWHEPRGKACAVCMAGAVMDRTLRVDPRASSLPCDTAWGGALRKIDLMRSGWHGYGAPCGAEPAANLIRKHLNNRTGRAPWRIYLRAADMLEAAGL